MIPKVFFSQSLDRLHDLLIDEIESFVDPMQMRTILVPNGQIRQWLLLEIARKKGIAMGLKVLEIEELFPQKKGSLEMFCLIYSSLLESQDPEVVSFIEDKKKRVLDLTQQLHSLFAKYSQYESLIKVDTWQNKLFKDLFLPQDLNINEPIIGFGIDYLPPKYWEVLRKIPLSLYLFSPCVEFWEDLCSDRDRKKLKQILKKRSTFAVALDESLRVGPRNLANWGKLGRTTLTELEDFEAVEGYASLEPTTLLKQIQHDLLTFQETEKMEGDSSIQILLTGSSRLREIEALKEEILHLSIPYHEISVLAPNIEPYVPLIQYVFGKEIPYRISGFDIGTQSSFRQGLIRLLTLGSSRWDVEEILALFETPAFMRKKGWNAETLEIFSNWIRSARIKWGYDASHRKMILHKFFDGAFDDEETWSQGLLRLLESIVYLTPLHINPELFEELLSTLFALKDLGLKGEKTLTDWADSLEKTAVAFLQFDPENEADLSAQNRICNLLLDMRKCSSVKLYPADVIMQFLNFPCMAQMHASQLHAVRIGKIEEGALIPAKALFLIGMDEMSFPKGEIRSSLDQLFGKTPRQADFDRYRFLQCIFSAEKFLRISYGHLSEEEGKPVGPSLLVQELLGKIAPKITQIYPMADGIEQKKTLVFPKFTKIDLPIGELTLSVLELKSLARHPWEFYLQKAHKIYLDKELEESFALKRGKLVKELFDKGSFSEKNLPGPFKKAMELEVFEKVAERKAQLAQWEINPFTLVLRENCKESTWEKDRFIAPCLELAWDNLKVKIVGEVQQASSKGIISSNPDDIGGTLKIWPEALVCALALNKSEIFMIRNGKNKSLNDPKKALVHFIEYYFHCLKSPSPLLPEWADAILRKNDLDKKIEQRMQFEDPVMDWVFARADLSAPVEMVQPWSPILSTTFQELIELYPVRGSGAKI